jgi:hypothetical protein
MRPLIQNSDGEILSQDLHSNTDNSKRIGWEKAFQEMAENGDDTLRIPDNFEDEELNDWTWG